VHAARTGQARHTRTASPSHGVGVSVVNTSRSTGSTPGCAHPAARPDSPGGAAPAPAGVRVAVAVVERTPKGHAGQAGNPVDTPEPLPAQPVIALVRVAGVSVLGRPPVPDLSLPLDGVHPTLAGRLHTAREAHRGLDHRDRHAGLAARFVLFAGRPQDGLVLLDGPPVRFATFDPPGAGDHDEELPSAAGVAAQPPTRTDPAEVDPELSVRGDPRRFHEAHPDAAVLGHVTAVEPDPLHGAR